MARKLKNKKKPIKKSASTKLTKRNLSPINFEIRKLSWIILGFVIIALILRIFNVGGLSLWVDEYVHVDGVIKFLDGKGSIIPYDGNSTLLNLFILPFFAIFGTDAFWSRLPSVVFGASSVYIVYMFAKETFNDKIGFYVAFILTFSLYAIFWSRVTRAYTLFSCLYLLSIYFFYKSFEPKALKHTIHNFWKIYNVNPKYLIFFGITFFLAILAHKLALIAGLSIGFYIIFRAIFTLFEKEKQPFLANKYQILAIPFVLFFIMFFSPSLTGFFRPVLGLFIPDNVIGWFLPDWQQLGELWTTERYKVFKIYEGVIIYDFQQLYWAGLVGLPLAFFINRNGALIQLCFFAIPLLLLSFVLRGVFNPRYIFFLYPLFLLSVAITLYFLFHSLLKRFAPNIYHSKLNYLLYFLPILIVLPFIRYQELKDFINVKDKNGYVVNKKLTSWSFTNWKDATHYLKANMQDGDAVMTTVPSATNYYMGWKDGGSIQFRQKYLDTYQGKYVNYEDSTSNLNAHTLENLARTIGENKRGWLLADYYFNTIYTDSRARQMVFKNMDFHFDATSSGDVSVFSWDRGKQKIYPEQNMVIALGRNRFKKASQKINFNVTEANLKKDKMTIQVSIQAASKSEAFLVLNEEYKYFIPANTTNGIEKFNIPVNSAHVKLESNIIQIGYNDQVAKNDTRKGFSIHLLSIL